MTPDSPSPPRTAIIGADGFLGGHLLAAYRRFHPDTLGTTRRAEPRLDLSAPDVAPLELARAGYESAIIAAAVTGGARCERDREATRACNVRGTLELAGQLAADGITPVWFSSDYVFDGVTGGYRDDDPAHPINEYGRQKAEVERRIIEVCHGNCLVLRLGRVLGRHRGDATLLDEMASRLSRGQAVRAARDQVFNPVLVDDVLSVLLELQATGATRLFNLCSPEVWTRLDLARAVAEELGSAPGLVGEMSLDDLGEDLRRPKNTSMIAQRLGRTLPHRFVPIQDAVRDVARGYRGVGGRRSPPRSRRPAILLDRDGVLNKDVHLLRRRHDLRLLPGAPRALLSLSEAGFKLIVVSNQTVVARGLATEEDVRDLHRELQQQVTRAGGPTFDAFYFCPHHPNADEPSYRMICECRKPRPGMILRAAAEHHLDLGASYMVGDRITDVIAGARAGCRTIQVETGRHQAPSIETAEPLDERVHPDHICPGLPEAARWILARRPD